MQGHDDVVRFLLEHGADPNIEDLKGMTPIFYSVTSNHLSTTRLLLEKGANPSSKAAGGGSTILCSAANDGNAPMIQLLIAAGARLNTYCGGGGPLLSAAMSRKREAVEALIAAGASLTSSDMMVVTKTGDKDIVALLRRKLRYDGTNYVAVEHR